MTSSLSRRKILPAFTFVVCGCLLSVSPIFAWAPQEMHERPGPLLEAGKLNEIIKLRSDGPNLATNITTRYADANNSLNGLRSKLRSGGGSSSSNDQWNVHMRSAELTGEFSFGTSQMGRVTGKGQNQSPKLRIELKELAGFRRELNVSAEVDGTLSIQIRSAAEPYLFRFRQAKDNRIICQELGVETVFSAEASSFDRFCHENPAFVETRLMPIFEFLGMGQPTTRFSPSVQEFVLRQLVTPAPHRIAEFKNAIEGLNGASFEDRQTASKSISDDFKKWQDLIERSISDLDYPVEVRSRLKKIYEIQMSEAEREKVRLALSGALHNEPEYLIWLWIQLKKSPSAGDEQDVTRIAKRLAEAAKQDHGLDLNRWQEWWSANAKQANPVVKTAQLQKEHSFLSQLGPIDAAQEFIGQLINLDVRERRLVVDRDHWATHFDGKTIQQLNENVVQLLKNQNLPAEWYRPGGEHSNATIDFPQVIFANMVNVLGQSLAPPRGQYSTLAFGGLQSRNREISTASAFARLEFHPQTGNERPWRNGIVRGNGRTEVPAIEYVSFYFRENVTPYRSLEVRENKDGSLVIYLLAEESDEILALIQSAQASDEKNRCRIFDIRPGQTTAFEAPDFQALYDQQDVYFRNQWTPIFERTGIQIDQAR